MPLPTKQIGSPIVVGGLYTYTGLPVRCQGCRYRVLGFVLDVPVYVEKVLVECLSGPDQGLLFVCSPVNFSLRYIPVKDDPPAAEGPPAPVPDKPAPFAPEGNEGRTATPCENPS